MKARVIGKVVLWAMAGMVLLTALTAGLVYHYQDKIIQLFVAEANKHIKTKVQVGKISLSLFDKFPQVAVSLEQVRVTESLPGSTTPLATVSKVYCTFSLRDILAKKYRARELYLQNGDVHVKVLASGAVNYLIWGKDTTATAAPSEAFSFNLNQVTLKNMQVTYHDASLKQFYHATAHDVQAQLDVVDQLVHVKSDGNVLVHTVRLDKSEYFKEKETSIQTAFSVDRDARTIDLASSVVQVGPAAYQVAGDINYAAETALDLKLEGKNTSIQSVLALLPPQVSRQFTQYSSEGQVYFNGTAKGKLSSKNTPLVQFAFGAKQASFFHPEYKQQLKNIDLAGSFTNGAQHNSQTSVLEFKNFKGQLAGRAFAGNLVYRNFQDPHLKLDLKADLDVGHVLGFFPVSSVRKGSGIARVVLNFAGKLSALKAGPGKTPVSASGDIVLQNVNLHLKQYGQPFRNLNGIFLIRKNDLAVTNFKGYLGDSDFLLNGYFKNAIGYLFLQKQRLRIEADFESRSLNLEQLLSSSQAPATDEKAAGPGRNTPAAQAGAYKLTLSPYLDFDINAQVHRLRFRRFRGKNIRGNVQLTNRIMSSQSITLQVIGGHFGLRGSLNGRQPNNLKVSTTAHVTNMAVDSLFYVFENFGQNFLVQRHLKGDLTATINSDLYFDSHLNARTERMEAEIKAAVRNGQLIYFEPLQKLSRFVDRRELANLRFSELSNTFYIQSRTVFIPEMEIRSNVSNASVIGIQGTHTFDQQMDYKFRIPLTKLGRRVNDETPAQTVAQGGPNLFLTLKGNEDNYKIAYDKERVKTKIVADFKREKQELKDLFKGKKPEKPERSERPEKQKEPQPQHDEYFDF